MHVQCQSMNNLLFSLISVDWVQRTRLCSFAQEEFIFDVRLPLFVLLQQKESTQCLFYFKILKKKTRDCLHQLALELFRTQSCFEKH